ncbi:MAG TPA: thiamine pyrophosphate-dependent enzyme [Chloroflexota bacterium]|nr:thiamine pyrophosphate-dependent enzyme [Chloroflexota bacterium]
MSVMEGTDALRLISRARREEVVVLSESCRQDWPPLSTREELDIAITGSMGKASSFGLGVALSQPDRTVWVLDTDGALLMNLGSLVTIARMKPANLVHFVYDNDAYDTTGGQPTPGSNMVNFQAIALDAGYPAAYRFDDLPAFEAGLAQVLAGPKPCLCVLKVASHGRRAGAGQMKRMYDSFTSIKSLLAS